MKKLFIGPFIPKEGEKAENESKSIISIILCGLVTFVALMLFGDWGFTAHPNWLVYYLYALTIIGVLSGLWQREKLMPALGDIGVIATFLASYYALFLSGWTIPYWIIGIIGIVVLCLAEPYVGYFNLFLIMVGDVLTNFIKASDSDTKSNLRLLQITSFLTLVTSLIAYVFLNKNIGLFIGTCTWFWIGILIFMIDIIEHFADGKYLDEIMGVLYATLAQILLILIVWSIGLPVAFEGLTPLQSTWIYIASPFVIAYVILAIIATFCE